MKLATFLTNKPMTQAAFAASLGVSQATINRYVTNERFPDPQMIERIASATGRKVTFADWHEQAVEAGRAKASAA
jgi:transcriptional regulator with XRE-family HTH domain